MNTCANALPCRNGGDRVGSARSPTCFCGLGAANDLLSRSEFFKCKCMHVHIILVPCSSYFPPWAEYFCSVRSVPNCYTTYARMIAALSGFYWITSPESDEIMRCHVPSQVPLMYQLIICLPRLEHCPGGTQ